MKRTYLFGIITLLFSLTSCIEIIDDLSLRSDGSGTFKYTVNLSASKVKINSYLALDSLDGKKVPSIEEISDRINAVIESLEKREGISNLTFDANYDNFILKLSFDFSSVEALQQAIKDVVLEESREKTIKELDETWITINEAAFNRSIPKLNLDRVNTLKQDEIAALKEGTYTSITRFDKEIEKCKNESSIISKSKKAVMLRTDVYSLSQNTSMLDNTIYLQTLESDK